MPSFHCRNTLTKKRRQTMNKELKGLTSAQVAESKSKFGTNELARKEPESLLSIICDAFKDFWIRVLCLALGIRLFFVVLGIFVPELADESGFLEVASIILAILLSTGFSAFSDYRNNARGEALQAEYSKTFAKVIRDGKLIKILTSEIVKGDIVLVQAGDKIPSDGLVRKGKIKVSQAALNGEPRDEKKSETDSNDEADSADYKSEHKVFMGSVVTSGEAYIETTVIGDNSELGKIALAIAGKDDDEEEERKDTSSLKLEVVAKGIGKLGVSAAAIAAILHIVLSVVRADVDITNAVGIIMLIADAIMLAASIIIMAVPEGLPMMNSLVQSMNSESMYKKNILVSHRAAFSDSAYMDILFSDKTGTITQGNLSLVEFIRGNGKVVRDISSSDFIDLITINNVAKISEGTAIGSNNIDRELLGYGIKHGFSESHKNAFMDKVSEITEYNSESKCATAELKDGSVMWKGATEIIIDKATHFIDEEGKKQPFTAKSKKDLLATMSKQTGRSMKLLSIAKIEGKETILHAVACFRDEVRTDAVQTVDILNTAGIQVVMVTGDAEDTAVAIAKEAGIYHEGTTDIVLTHEELAKMSDDEVKKKINNLRVVSRAKPLDKKRLVSIAQSLDHVCGMTGDGVNDAPALVQADVGFAMGDGTAVAQEAGDVVILNNSLTSIKDCVLNSRTMSKSVGKFLIFQLTVNVSTLLMNILAPILGWIEPFSIVQILWINIIMDTLAALAFGGEPILDRYMNEKPAKRTDPILTGYIKSAIGTSAIFITVGSIIILENLFGILDFVRPAGMDEATMLVYDKSFMFAFFIYSIIFNSLNTRSDRMNVFEHIGQNKRFILVMGSIFLLQTFMLFFGGAVFGTVRLTMKGYLASIILALLIIPVDCIRKMIYKSVKK